MTREHKMRIPERLYVIENETNRKLDEMDDARVIATRRPLSENDSIYINSGIVVSAFEGIGNLLDDLLNENQKVIFREALSEKMKEISGK